MAGYAAQEEIRQDVDHIDRLQLARDPDRQALVGEGTTVPSPIARSLGALYAYIVERS